MKRRVALSAGSGGGLRSIEAPLMKSLVIRTMHPLAGRVTARDFCFVLCDGERQRMEETELETKGEHGRTEVPINNDDKNRKQCHISRMTLVFFLINRLPKIRSMWKGERPLEVVICQTGNV